MYCKWCGMESKDNKKCEWCGRPFPATDGENATMQMPPAEAPAPRPAAPPRAGMRQIDDATTQMSAAPQDTTVAMRQIGDPTPPPSRQPYIPPSLPKLEIEIAQLAPFGARIEKCLALVLIPLAIATFASHYVYGSWVWWFMALTFFTGLMLGITRTIGYYDNDDSLDTLIGIVTALFVGPLYATVAVLVVGLLRKNPHWPVIGLLTGVLTIQLMLGIASYGAFVAIGSMVAYVVHLDPITGIISGMPTILAFAGWFMAGFSRPLNEN